MPLLQCWCCEEEVGFCLQNKMTEKKAVLFRSFESFGYAIITFSYNYLSSPVDFQGHIPQKLLPNIAVSYLNVHCCVVQD